MKTVLHAYSIPSNFIACEMVLPGCVTFSQIYGGHHTKDEQADQTLFLALMYLVIGFGSALSFFFSVKASLTCRLHGIQTCFVFLLPHCIDMYDLWTTFCLLRNAYVGQFN